jgi:hypothetical protein
MGRKMFGLLLPSHDNFDRVFRKWMAGREDRPEWLLIVRKMSSRIDRYNCSGLA